MQSKRVALVTGANQGVGFQVAKELVANGLTVLAGSRQFRARRGRSQRDRTGCHRPSARRNGSGFDHRRGGTLIRRCRCGMQSFFVSVR